MEMINAILIEVLGAIAENERNKIRARQREGIAAAKKKNVRFGRPSKPLPDNWREVLAEVRSIIFFSASFALSHHIWGSCSAQPAFTAIIGASFSG